MFIFTANSLKGTKFKFNYVTFNTHSDCTRLQEFCVSIAQ